MNQTSYSIALVIKAPDWVHLLPFGEIQPADGRDSWKLDNPQSVIDNSFQDHDRLVIDYDHQTDYAPRPGVGGVAPAAGWIVEMQPREDGIWAKVIWTPAGRNAIETSEYRWLSPVFEFDTQGIIQCIIRAGLTNDPALSLTALANTLVTHRDNTNPTVTNTLNNDSVPRPVFEQMAYDFARLQASVDAKEAELAVNNAMTQGKLAPAQRKWALGYAKSDPQGFQRFIARAPQIIEPGQDQRLTRHPHTPTALAWKARLIQEKARSIGETITIDTAVRQALAAQQGDS